MPIIYQRVNQTTTLEIIFALGLLFILGGVFLWVLNPMERVRRSQDSQRLADLERLSWVIDSTASEGTPLPKTMGVPASSSSVGATQAVNGSGWIAMNLSDYLDLLPTDPENGKIFADVVGNSVTGEYQFISDGTYYVLRTHLKAKINKSKYGGDGNENDWYEVGTAPGLSAYFGL